MWQYTGRHRPDFAVEPGPGQESVWDYPRPPALLPATDHVRVLAGDELIADTRTVLRMLETASPPTYYLPADAIHWERLLPVGHSSFCEWKGRASYFALATAPNTPVAWLYENPAAQYAAIDRQVSFYPSLLECFVDGERVRPQSGGFYGGWITDRIVGPWKGGPGTGHW